MIITNERKYLNITETRDYVKENTPDNKKLELEGLRKKAQIQIDSRQDSHPYDTAIKTDDDYYFELDFIDDNIELYSKSVEAFTIYPEIIKMDPKKSSVVLSRIVTEKFGAHKIPLFGIKTLYLDSSTCRLLMSELKKIYDKNWITKKEIRQKFSSTYAGFKAEYTINRLIDNAVAKYDLEVIPGDNKYNIFTNGATLYPKKTVDKILEYIRDNLFREMNFINMTYEDYLSLSKDDFENSFVEFTKEQADRIEFNSEFFYILANLNNAFRETNVKIFKINNHKIYASKYELDEFADLMNNWVCASPYFKELGIKFNSSTAKTNGIDCFIYKNHSYIKKTDIERYKLIAKRSDHNKSLREAMSLHDRVKLKLEYAPHKKESNYPNTKSLILSFAKHSNANTDVASQIDRLYRAILDEIKFDLTSFNQSENDKLFRSILKVSEGESSKLTSWIIAFMNFLRNKRNFYLMSASDTRSKVSKRPYPSEEFINLLSAMLTVVSDNDKISKLYRNWRLSTSFSYVFLHYCLAWRRKDLVNNLPLIDLSLVSNDVSDGESFIQWLENGNKLSYKQARYICKSLEEETSRLRKKATKNKELLNCIISDALMWEVATLLCINEANRQIYIANSRDRNRIRKDRNFLNDYTCPSEISKQLTENLDIDINKILNGIFDNIRMNKGFMSLVRDKAEELNLFAYSYMQVLRSHKFTPNKLSEVTKIYLNKSIDRGSLLAFSTGTMGSVLYILKQLIDDDFNFRTIDHQIKDIKKLNITPYQLEVNIRSINNKVKTLNDEIKRYFTGHGTKEELLEKLLYGQTFNGIEMKTKCLIKITRDEENILRISPVESTKNSPNNRCPLKRRSCIGCDYMIALRYFVYEFENKYNQILTNYENAESDIDKEIFKGMINNIYNPLMNDLAAVLGKEAMYEIFDLTRLAVLSQQK